MRKTIFEIFEIFELKCVDVCSSRGLIADLDSTLERASV